MKKVLIVGPFADIGGRELEASFIAMCLSKEHDVSVLTTSISSKSSQIYYYDNKIKLFELNKLIYNSDIFIRIIAWISFIKNSFKGSSSNYISNKFSKKYFDYYKKIDVVLDHFLNDFDILFICATFSSFHLEQILNTAKSKNIKVIFRTTGQIDYVDYNYLKDIDLFVHSSIKNSLSLSSHQFSIIDQCAFDEVNLLKISPSFDNCNFLIVGRLSPEKGIQEGIELFLKFKLENDILRIVGDGELKEELISKYGNSRFIKFCGHVNHENIHTYYEMSDCVLITSYCESGPLTGIEAMAAGKIMISTKVGAMEERLDGTLNDFWFELHEPYSFREQFNKFKNLSSNDQEQISYNLRERYLNSYSSTVILNKYLSVINNK